MLAVYERRAAGKDSYDFAVWRRKGMWRFNRNSTGNEEGFTDRVWGDGSAWVLSRNTLTLLNPSTAAQHPYGVPSSSSGFSNDLFFLLNGGLGAAVLHGFVFQPELSGDKWLIQAEKPQGDDMLRVRATGSWNQAEGWGTVDRMEFSRSLGSGRVASYEVATSGWVFVPALQLGVASRAEIVDSERGPDRRLTLLDTAPFSPAEFEALTAPPSMAGVDPSRGKLTFRSVIDLTGNQLDVKMFDDQGTLVERRTSSGVQGAPASDGQLRILGWLMAIAALLLMGGVWIRRRALSSK